MRQVPDCSHWKLDQLDFNDFSLPSEDMILAAIRIFTDTGLVAHFKIDYEVHGERKRACLTSIQPHYRLMTLACVHHILHHCLDNDVIADVHVFYMGFRRWYAGC